MTPESNVPYNFLSQPMTSSLLVQSNEGDGFFFPQTNGHNGFAANGFHYTNGVRDSSPPSTASWFSEGPGPYRGTGTAFPTQALVLLGRASMAILDETTTALNLWMLFLLSDGLALTDNFALGNLTFSSPPDYLIGFTPSGLAYANGKLTVVFSLDPGSSSILSTLSVTISFTDDTVYLDVAT